MKQIKVGLLVAGVKGLNFLKAFPPDAQIDFVASYPFKGLQFQPANEIQSYCRQKKYRYFDSKELKNSVLASADVIFVAGWQFLLKVSPEKLVILHDSLLPRFRGFSPTINALICGEKKIGVTAFKPVETADAGPIYHQIGLSVKYPLKIGDVYKRLGSCYARCAIKVLDMIRHGNLKGKIQNEKKATYSIWRGENDLFVDWTSNAKEIRRFVDALGWPYSGARTVYDGKIILINEVKPVSERKFELRHSGKIWAITSNAPEVICGEGMIRILNAKNLDGSTVFFKRLKVCLGNS